MSRLLVVGNGMSADRLLDDLISRGCDHEITVVGEEPGPAYNRILLTKLLGGTDADMITTRTSDWYASNGIRLVSGRWVQRLDTSTRVAHIGNGETLDYDVAVLATGSSAIVPPVTGVLDRRHRRTPGVHLFRTIEDALALQAETDPSFGRRRVVVVGGGLLGLEAAKAMADLGHGVTLVHSGATLLNAQLDAVGGMLLRAAVARLGIAVVLGRTESVLARGHVEAVRLDDGRTFDADTVIFATGVRPRIETATASQLDTNRAIVVDDRMRTSAPGVFAIGECAELDGTTYGLVAPCWDQAAVVADLLTGKDARYVGSPVSSRLKVTGVEVASMGAFEAECDSDQVVQVIEERRGIYRKLVVRDGRLAGAVLVGDPDSAPRLARLFERGEQLPPNPVDLFCSPSAFGAVAVDADVCNCNRVGEPALLAAINAGASSVEELRQATRAGTGCGSCVGSLTALLRTAAPAA